VGLVMIVLKDVNDGELPNGCKIERFVEGALFRGTVAEKAIDNLACVLDLRCQRGAGRMRDGLPDDAGCAGKVGFRVRQIDRAAKTSAKTVSPAVDLRHDFSG